MGKHPRFVCFNEVDTAVIASARLSLYIWRGVICNFSAVNPGGKIVSFLVPNTQVGKSLGTTLKKISKDLDREPENEATEDVFHCPRLKQGNAHRI